MVIMPIPVTYAGNTSIVEQDLFDKRMGEEDFDEFSGGFAIVFDLLPRDGQMKTIFPERSDVYLKTIDMRTVVHIGDKDIF